MFTFVFQYILFPLWLIYMLLRVFGAGQKTAAKPVLLALTGIVIIFFWLFCTLTGLLISFLYEPTSYWHSIVLDDSYIRSFMDGWQPEGQMYKALEIVPRYVIQVIIWAWNITINNCTWAIVIADLMGLSVVINFSRAFFGFKRQYENPQFMDMR